MIYWLFKKRVFLKGHNGFLSPSTFHSEMGSVASGDTILLSERGRISNGKSAFGRYDSLTFSHEQIGYIQAFI